MALSACFEFAAMAVAFEDFEGVSQFFDGAVHEFHFASAGLVVGELQDRKEHVCGEFAVGGDVGGIEERGDFVQKNFVVWALHGIPFVRTRG